MSEEKQKWYKKPKNIAIMAFVLICIIYAGQKKDSENTNKKTNKEENFKIGSTYAFFTSGCDFNCNECDYIWKIKFVNDKTAELWSHSSKSDFPSCKSDVTYSYANDVIDIKSINNSNVSSSCKSSIIGKYKYTEKKNGFGDIIKVFQSQKDSDCNLSWYK